MNELVRRVRSFVTFNFALQPAAISKQFLKLHSFYQQQFPGWSLGATRKKIAIHFWLQGVLIHCSFILLSIGVLAFPILKGSSSILIPTLLAGMVSLLTFTIFHYYPIYYSDFLPQLDTIVAEQEKLLRDQEEIKKCKRTQYSTPTLTIIFYVFCKTSNIPLLPSNDPSADLLNKLYGVDRDKLKQNLSRLYKLKRLSVKERAEIQKGIDAAREFFEKLTCPSAQTILDQLQAKINKV